MPNLIDKISKEEQDKIGREVKENYERDLKSCTKFFEANRRYLKLASAVRDGEKLEPWPGASDLVMPILTLAAVQFWSRAYSQLVPPHTVVTVDRTGAEDAEKATRREKHQNHQLKETMPFWLSEQSTAMLRTGLSGTVFKKTFYNAAYKRVESRLLGAEDLVMPYSAMNVEECPRKTHKLFMTANDIKIQVAQGVFIKEAKNLGPGTNNHVPQSATMLQEDTREDRDVERLILEQHCNIYIEALDGDSGIALPRVATVDYESGLLLRLVDNGDKIKYEQRSWFTPYYFLPNPESGVYGWGLGMLMEHANESVNSILNQLTDAGRLCTNIGGFVNKRGPLGKRKGAVAFQMGKFIEIDGSGDDVRKNIYIHDFPEPSQTLFQVLDLLLGYAEKIGSISDITTGEMPPRDVAATAILKIAEEGQKVYGTIYRGLHRSAKSEFGKIARLNEEHHDIEQYMQLLGDAVVRDIAEQVLTRKPMLSMMATAVKKLNGGELPIAYAQSVAKAVLEKDFTPGVDLIPVSDPNVTSKMEAVAKAQMLKQDVMSDPFRSQDRKIVHEVTNRLYKELAIDGIETINPEPVDEALVDKTPLEEEADFIRDVSANVLPQQDHYKHLQSHQTFVETIYAKQLTPHGKELLDAHIRETWAALYTAESGLGNVGQNAGNAGAFASAAG